MGLRRRGVDVSQDTVNRLNNGEGEEEDGGGDGENGPGIGEVGVHEIGPPLVPGLLAVSADLLVNLVEGAVRVEGDVLGEGVEELGDGLVAAEGVLNDAAGVEQADVAGAVDDVVHEEYVGGDLVPGPHVEALERDQVQVQRLQRVVHHDQRQLQHSALE